MAAGMAGDAAASHGYRQQQSILVAVEPDIDDLLGVSGGCALAPEFASRAAPVVRLAGFECTLESLGIHVSEHDDRPVLGVGHDGGDQSVLVVAWREDDRLFVTLAHLQSEKPPEGERTSSMKRACSTGFDLNSPVNWVVMVATLRLLTPRSDMH